MMQSEGLQILIPDAKGKSTHVSNIFNVRTALRISSSCRPLKCCGSLVKHSTRGNLEASLIWCHAQQYSVSENYFQKNY